MEIPLYPCEKQERRRNKLFLGHKTSLTSIGHPCRALYTNIQKQRRKGRNLPIYMQGGFKHPLHLQQTLACSLKDGWRLALLHGVAKKELKRILMCYLMRVSPQDPVWLQSVSRLHAKILVNEKGVLGGTLYSALWLQTWPDILSQLMFMPNFWSHVYLVLLHNV